MALITTDISDLLVHLHTGVDSMHRTMKELSDPSSHDAEVARLEEECERKVSALRVHHDGMRKQIEERRRREGVELAEKRVQEEKEIAERRRREDEERRRRIEVEEEKRERERREENETREREREECERGVMRSAEEDIGRLEGEMRRRWEEGREKVRELDKKRKEINRKIDEMLSLPVEYPKAQSRRKTKFNVQNSSILRDSSSHSPPSSLCGDPMLERLWNGEMYASERHVEGPSKSDPMLSRLWSNQKYPVHIHFRSQVDPMLDRLWSNDVYGNPQTDPMLERLWSDKWYMNSAEEPEFDPMLRRLWSGIRYPDEICVSNIHHPSLYDDPMLARLWNGEMYEGRERELAKDPMMQRLWAAIRYREDPMISRLWDATRYREDPMISRLWAATRYREDPMISRLSAATRYREDPMISRLWAATRFREDPMISRLSAPTRYREDSMISRLWAATRYRDDPMISRLWATVRYEEDPILSRLWNGESYFDKETPGGEFHNVVFTSEIPLKSPVPWSPIPKDLYLHSGKYPAHHVSEVQDSSDEEDEIDVTSSKRQSGVFTAFFNSIKTDIPLVNDFLNHQEYGTVPIEDPFGDEYIQHEPLLYHAPDEQHVHFEDLLPSESHGYDTETDDEEFPFRSNNSSTAPSSTPLRIQTNSFPLPPHTENPFDMHFPSSGAPSSPATPSDTASHTFQEMDLHHDHDHERGVIPDSWSPPREELHLAPRVSKTGGAGGENDFAGYVSYIPPPNPSVVGGEHQGEGAMPGTKRGVGNHFNSVPQNPRLSVVAEAEGAEEDDGSGEVGGRAAFLGRLSRFYYGGSGEERGKLLDGDEER